MAGEGLTLVGTTNGFEAGVLSFSADLAANLASGDADYLSLLDQADAWVAAHAADLPEEPEARNIPTDPPFVSDPIRALDLAEAGITSIVWATGYELDFRWLRTAAVDGHGQPVHRRGISAEPGVYFLGLPWQTRRGSSFIWGVWYDAKYIADHIAKQRAYLEYRPG
jgi:putative flavoprotein involved in K+ transport